MAKRILIVEDDDDIASIERDYLEVGGYEVTVEENGTAGLTEALTGDYDLILLDIMLPGMDGFQIVRKLRDKVDIPIMMVTARRSDIDKIRGLGFGADDYIEKPFSPGDAAAALKPGEVLLLENLRFYPEEEGKPVGIDKEDPAYEDAKKAMKASQKEFAKTLASYADCYINDAFGTAHRKHASTAVIADYFDADNKMLGYLMEKEVQAVDNILKDIKRPFTAIMGGSKVSTKIGIIENLMDKVDNLILCGGMTYTFAKAQGGKIGNSIVEDDKLDLALDIIAKAKAKGVNLVLGSDCVAADAFSNDAHTQVVPANNIPDGWEGLDAGPETQKAFAAAIEDAKTILWNGPAGVFEFDNFTAGSRAIAEAIAKATKNGAFSLIGGGDSVACINKFGMADQVSYISTGGGALLEAIEGKILPGVAAIKGE